MSLIVFIIKFVAVHQDQVSLEHHQEVESAAITFFKTITQNHAANQLRLANVLCDILRLHGVPETAGGIASNVVGSFVRRFMLEVLLEEEKVSVSVHTPHSKLWSLPNNSFNPALPHPQYGTGHRCRVIVMSVHHTCADVVHKLTGMFNCHHFAQFFLPNNFEL